MGSRLGLGVAFLGLLLLLPGPGPAGEAALRTKLTPLRRLQPGETVFAYSRIPPDGERLAYTSERPRGGELTRTVTVVDLRRNKVVFTEPGLDSYWAPDGRRLIYVGGGADDVCIWHRDTGKVARNVVRPDVGAYLTWADAGGRDLILTQRNHYFFLEKEEALRPYRRVHPCRWWGRASSR